MGKKIVVGSLNPVKVEAVEAAFGLVFPSQVFEVVGCEVESGVSSQPMSEAESIQGALQRAKLALKNTGADYGVGLEGGLHQLSDLWFDSGWIVVCDKNGNIGIGETVKMIVPPQVMKLVHAGDELGVACDKVFGISNSKQKQGHFGLMTNNAVTRATCYRDGVISALAKFTHPELF